MILDDILDQIIGEQEQYEQAAPDNDSTAASVTNMPQSLPADATAETEIPQPAVPPADAAA